MVQQICSENMQPGMGKGSQPSWVSEDPLTYPEDMLELDKAAATS